MATSRSFDESNIRSNISSPPSYFEVPHCDPNDKNKSSPRQNLDELDGACASVQCEKAPQQGCHATQL